jgi:hypothetical protein
VYCSMASNRGYMASHASRTQSCLLLNSALPTHPFLRFGNFSAKKSRNASPSPTTTQEDYVSKVTVQDKTNRAPTFGVLFGPNVGQFAYRSDECVSAWFYAHTSPRFLPRLCTRLRHRNFLPRLCTCLHKIKICLP